MDKIQKIQDLLKLVNESLTRQEFVDAFKAVMDYVKKIEAKNNTELDSIQSQFLDLSQQIKDGSSTDLAEFKKEAVILIDEQLGKLIEAQDKKIAQIDSKLSEVVKGDPGQDGKDADEELIIEEVTKKVVGAIVLPDDSAEAIANKLETLKDEARLDAKAIKNLPEFVENVSQGSGLRNVFHDTTLTGTGTAVDPLKVVGGGGGGGAWGSITGTLSDQTDLQTVLDLKAPLASPIFTTSITGNYLTASQLLGTDGSKNIVSLPTASYPSLTELTYVKGITSAVQTQLDAKQATISLTTTGTSGAATLVGSTLNIPNYTYTLPTASTSVLGGVKVDGTTITITGGVISAAGGGSGTVTSVASADGSITVTNGTTTADLAVVKAPKWTTARNLAGNSVDGSANVAFANNFIVQGTTDAGLSGAQFLGALGTGIVKNTTTTGILSIAIAADFPTLNQNTTGSAATLTTPRTIGGVSFNGSANITVATATGGFTISGGDLALGANNLTMTGSLGATGARLTKGWFTDLQVTNAIAGSITGNAATVTNATLTTALTVNTGTLTLTANAANTSVLTIGAGAVSVSGANTGDQNIFSTIVVSGQTTVTTGSTSQALTLVAGTNVSITTNNSTKTVTINSSAGGTGLTVGSSTITSGSDTKVLFDNVGVLGEYSISGSGNVAMTTSPVLTTPTLGVATATSINKVAITAPATSATLAIADGKALTVSNSLTLAGTDSTVMTFPTTSATIARTDAANTFTGVQIFNSKPSITASSIGISGSVSGTYTLSAGSSGSPTLTLPNATDTLAGISATQTMTNKRNQPRITSATSYTTDTGTSLDVSTTDIFIVTAQAGALKFNNPSGTPVQGEKLLIRIKDNGTARALTYDTQFRASSDLALPTTTVLSKTLYMGFIYNATDTKWDLLAVLNNI